MHGVQARISVHRNAALLVLIVIFSFAMSVLLASDLTTRASATSEGDGELPSFSASGRHIALESQVSDLGMGTATRISVAGDGTEENGLSYVLSISSDGQLGAFVSNASNVIAADNSGK